MRIMIRCLTTLFAAAGVSAAVLLAPIATAAPECTNTGPTTTLCETNGSSQLVTSPPAMDYNSYYGGFPFGGGFVIGFPF